jgi:DNA-binding beta-propeller fold protein YncE
MKTRRYRSVLATVLAFTLPSITFAAPTVYMPLGKANEVIGIDAATNKITATFTGVENSHGLVATPDGEYLVAGSLAETPAPKDKPDAPTSKLYLIHPAHGHVMLTIPVKGFTHHEAITPDGRYVLSTHPTRGYVSAVDLQSNQVAHTIKTGPAPNYTLVTRDGKTAFVSNTGNGTISEIDLGKWKVVRTLEAGPGPEHLAFSKDQKMIYAANYQAGTISVVSVKTGKVGKTFKVGSDVHGLDISDDGTTLFATSRKDNKLVAINARTGSERTLGLMPAPYHLNTIHGTGKVYVSSRQKPILWVVDQKKLKVLGQIELPGGEGHQMAVVK